MGDIRYKGEALVDDYLTFKGDESIIDHAKLMMFVEDGNIFPHRTLVEKVHGFSEYKDDKTGSEEEKGEEIVSRQPVRKTTFIIFQMQKKQKVLNEGCMIPYHFPNSQIKIVKLL